MFLTALELSAENYFTLGDRNNAENCTEKKPRALETATRPDVAGVMTDGLAVCRPGLHLPQDICIRTHPSLLLYCRPKLLILKVERPRNMSKGRGRVQGRNPFSRPKSIWSTAGCPTTNATLLMAAEPIRHFISKRRKGKHEKSLLVPVPVRHRVTALMLEGLEIFSRLGCITNGVNDLICNLFCCD
ncbi:hypothetical protein HZH66_012487 [Vespula vulgaris]|uniref:Uncharacterized protein n=1 Tax=Vespula vulgaris TaxID=7454 RepID=A0A834JBP4_VESVU|nr:hypothetical protein HZH66_012487 [Vespula vulgaris]